MPESIVHAGGEGPALELLQPLRGKLLVASLEITRIAAQQGIVVSIWGSPDNLDWGSKPLATFPQKYYCGSHSTFLNLSRRPDVRFLRVEWQMKRWARRQAAEMCAFYVCAQEYRPLSRRRAAAAIAASRSTVG